MHRAGPAAPRPAAPEGPAGAPQIVLAFDFGHRRIGVACGDTVSRTAAPLDAVPVGSRGPRWEAIALLLREWQPGLIVVGLPLSLSGRTGPAARAALAEVEMLRAAAGDIEVVVSDERLTTVTAERALREARMPREARRRVVDKVAAAVMLQSWLDRMCP